MIRLNVFLLIEEESNRRPLIEAATRLTELSLHDKGCISYDPIRLADSRQPPL